MQRPLPKFQLATDVLFLLALGAIHVVLSQYLAEIRSEINVLFIASYLLLALGALTLYLVFSVNSKLALNLHIWIFPLLALLNLFLRWIPNVIGTDGSLPTSVNVQIFSGGLLVYVLALFAFFFVQLITRAREFEHPVE